MTKRSYSDIELDAKDQLDDIKKELLLPEGYCERHVPQFSKACDLILSVDPSLFDLLISNDFVGFLRPAPGSATPTLQDYFMKLGTAIIAQQINGVAASNIKGKVMALFEDKFPTFEVLNTYIKISGNKTTLRGCGLSQRKIQYLESLSDYFVEKEEEITAMFAGVDNDDEIVEELVSNVKGIGPWSAKMFLMSGLKRMNVFTPDDIGAARGFSKYVADKQELLDRMKILLKEESVADATSQPAKKKVKKAKTNSKRKWKQYDHDLMEKVAEQFVPYRSVFQYLLWRLSNDDLEKMVEMESKFNKTGGNLQ